MVWTTLTGFLHPSKRRKTVTPEIAKENPLSVAEPVPLKRDELFEHPPAVPDVSSYVHPGFPETSADAASMTEMQDSPLIEDSEPEQSIPEPVVVEEQAPIIEPVRSSAEQLEAQWASIRYASGGTHKLPTSQPTVAAPPEKSTPESILTAPPSGVTQPTSSGPGEIGLTVRNDEESTRQVQLAEPHAAAHGTDPFTMLHTFAQRWNGSLPKRQYFVIAGSRSEARRLSPVIRRLRLRFSRTTEAEEVCVCTVGENPVPVREALELSGVSVDCMLEITTEGQTADALRIRVLNSLEGLLGQVRPQWVIVSGSTLINGMAVLAAYHSGIKVARVDSGLPQEEDDPDAVNKQLVDLFSSVHFAETNSAKDGLVHWGVPQESIVVIGNTGIDALHEGCVRLGLPIGDGAYRSSGTSQIFISVGHRQMPENDIREICRAVGNLCVLMPGLYEFVWSLPENAQLSETICKLMADVPGLKLVSPATYEETLRYLSACDIVMTDSQDLQEEAPSLGKPVLMTCEVSDRTEAVRAGIVVPVELSSSKIQAALRALARRLSTRHGQVTNPYGDGKASTRIADFLEGRLVLEFGKTTLPRLFSSPEDPIKRLPGLAAAWRLG